TDRYGQRRPIRARFVPAAFRTLKRRSRASRFGTDGELPARHAPADHGGFHHSAGFVVAPFAGDKAAGERQLVGAAVILAQHLHRLVRRRFAMTVKFGETSFARCHSLHLRYAAAEKRRRVIRTLWARQTQRANAVSLWYSGYGSVGAPRWPGDNHRLATN